jgi:hypothetical protein
MIAEEFIVDPITIAALLGLGGKALEAGVNAWKAWLDNGRGGVAFATDGSQYALPKGGGYLSSVLGDGGGRELDRQVPFKVEFVAADGLAQTYLDAGQPALLVIEDQNDQSRLDSIVAIGTLGDGFEGTLLPGHYLLGVYVFLDSNPDTWNDIDGGGFAEFSVASRQSPFLLQVPVEAMAEPAFIYDAPQTVDFQSAYLVAGQQHEYSISMEAGVTYRVYVQPADLSADFDLAVFDENGNLIDEDDDPASDAACEVTPRWTGPFDLVVSCHYGRSAYEILVQA